MILRALAALPALLLIAAMTLAAQKGPAPPGAREKCPVCGMFVAKYPDWTAAIIRQDGTTIYFDGAKDLFAYSLNPGKYGAAGQQPGTGSVWVKDYYTLALIDGRTAFYVTGSNLLGPMGNELIPFGKKADAESFLQDHRGKKILRFGDVTPQVLKSLE